VAWFAFVLGFQFRSMRRTGFPMHFTASLLPICYAEERGEAEAVMHFTASLLPICYRTLVTY